MTDKQLRPNAQPWRGLIAQGFVRVEDAVYVGLGTLLAAIALVLLVAVAVAFVQALLGATLPDRAEARRGLASSSRAPRWRCRWRSTSSSRRSGSACRS